MSWRSVLFFVVVIVAGFTIGTTLSKTRVRQSEQGQDATPHRTETVDRSQRYTSAEHTRLDSGDCAKAALLALTAAAELKAERTKESSSAGLPPSSNALKAHRNVAPELLRDPALVREVFADQLHLTPEQKVTLENAVLRLNRDYESQIGAIPEILATDPKSLSGRALVDRMVKFLTTFQAVDDELKAKLPVEGLERFDLFSQISPDVMTKIDLELANMARSP